MKRSVGFTLVEMLIVLSIIAILAALLFAMMGPARDRARQTVCVSNMHQIGKALRMYMDDYDAMPAEIGSQQSLYALGLPPLSAYTVFERKYLGSRQAELCPAYHGPFPEKEMAGTYIFNFYADADVERKQAVISKVGGRFPIIGDLWHNPWPGDSPPAGVLSWESKRVIALRLDLSVDNKRVPAYQPFEDF